MLRRRTSQKLLASLMMILLAQACRGQVPEDGRFRWRVGPPLLDAVSLPGAEEFAWTAVKDPSVVQYDGRWHLFCTLRNDRQGDGRIRIGYLSFDEWENAKYAKWSLLTLTAGYHGAPQIFWFEPEGTWYLIYQAEDATRGLKYGPCYSTNPDVSKPNDWTLPQPIYVVPEGAKAGLDFWVICDTAKAYLFFTTLDGRMWRAATELESFPDKNWSAPQVALEADIFEASHTYKLANEQRYLTFVEAQGDRRRYFKAFVADSLDGQWRALAATEENSFVSPRNIVNQKASWATSYSHGELIRNSYDQSLTIDPNRLRLLFQGANDDDYRNNAYGQIPWRLGLLTLEQ